MFVEKEPVIYKEFRGTISFVGNEYVVIDIPPKDIGRNPARLIVYRQNYQSIIRQNEV